MTFALLRTAEQKMRRRAGPQFETTVPGPRKHDASREQQVAAAALPMSVVKHHLPCSLQVDRRV